MQANTGRSKRRYKYIVRTVWFGHRDYNVVPQFTRWNKHRLPRTNPLNTSWNSWDKSRGPNFGKLFLSPLPPPPRARKKHKQLPFDWYMRFQLYLSVHASLKGCQFTNGEVFDFIGCNIFPCYFNLCCAGLAGNLILVRTSQFRLFCVVLYQVIVNSLAWAVRCHNEIIELFALYLDTEKNRWHHINMHCKIYVFLLVNSFFSYRHFNFDKTWIK